MVHESTNFGRANSKIFLDPETPGENVQKAAADRTVLGRGLATDVGGLFAGTTDDQ